MAPRARQPGSMPEKSYTEKALRFLKRKIPRVVYLPAALRGHNQTITTDHLVVRITGPEMADNHARIQEADPLGHMIATMHGLPIPRFVVRCGYPGCLNENQDQRPCDPSHHDYEATIRVFYHTPSHAEQTAAARFLATRITYPTPSAYMAEWMRSRKNSPAPGGARAHAHDYEAMIAAALAAREAADDEEENGNVEA